MGDDNVLSVGKLTSFITSAFTNNLCRTCSAKRWGSRTPPSLSLGFSDKKGSSSPLLSQSLFSQKLHIGISNPSEANRTLSVLYSGCSSCIQLGALTQEETNQKNSGDLRSTLLSSPSVPVREAGV